MCTISPPGPPHEAPQPPGSKLGGARVTASGANINQECSLCRRPCCLGPNFEFGVRGHVSDKAPSAFFFAPTGHPFQGRLLLESTLRFRIYAADPTWGTHHGDPDRGPRAVVRHKQGRLSRKAPDVFRTHSNKAPSAFFSHLPVTRFRVVSSLKALPCRPLSSPVVPACRPLCFCVVPCRPRIFKIKII